MLPAKVEAPPAFGYAKHVSSADCGLSFRNHSSKKRFLATLEIARDADSRVRWSKSGTEYGKHKSLNEGKGRATEMIIARALEANTQA